MKSAEDRIKDLARSKSLDDEAAASLLEAVRATSKAASRDGGVLTNPFARYSGELTATAGVIVSAAGLLASRVGVRFDGALDVHTTSSSVLWRVAWLDQLVAFPLTALVFWGVARFAARHVRFVDVAGVVGLSRAPSTLIAVPLALLAPSLSPGGAMTPALAVVVTGSLAAIGAHLYLLFTGFRTATALRGGRAVALFIAGVVLVEIVSKLALSLV